MAMRGNAGDAGHVPIGMYWVQCGHPQEVPLRSVHTWPGIDSHVVMAMRGTAEQCGAMRTMRAPTRGAPTIMAQSLKANADNRGALCTFPLRPLCALHFALSASKRLSTAPPPARNTPHLPYPPLAPAARSHQAHRIRMRPCRGRLPAVSRWRCPTPSASGHPRRRRAPGGPSLPTAAPPSSAGGAGGVWSPDFSRVGGVWSPFKIPLGHSRCADVCDPTARLWYTCMRSGRTAGLTREHQEARS